MLRRMASYLLVVSLCPPLALAQAVASNSTGAGAANAANLPKPGMQGFGLEDGTPIKLRTARTVSSADAHAGDTLDFEVLEEVQVNGVLVVPKGGIAWGTVTEAEPKRRMARGGKLNVNIDAVRLTDGEKVALRAVKEVKGGGHTGAMTGGMVATAIVFFPAAPFFLFMHGKDITIPKGTEITAYINGDTRLDQAKFQSVTGKPEPTVASAAPSNGGAQLDIGSTPSGADIDIDGNFVGSTPSSVSVVAGDHMLRITKKGFVPWERKIRSSSGALRVSAELEPATAPSPASAAPAGAAPGQKIVTATPETNPSAPAPQLRPAVLSSAEKPAAQVSSLSPASTETDGTASITSTPGGAAIFVDSVGRGDTPVLLKLKPGKHTVQLVMQGYKDFVDEIEVTAGSIVNVTANLQK